MLLAWKPRGQPAQNPRFYRPSKVEGGVGSLAPENAWWAGTATVCMAAETSSAVRGLRGWEPGARPERAALGLRWPA